MPKTPEQKALTSTAYGDRVEAVIAALKGTAGES